MPVCSSDERANVLTSNESDPIVNPRLQRIRRQACSSSSSGKGTTTRRSCRSGPKEEGCNGCTPEFDPTVHPPVTAHQEWETLLETLHRSGTLRTLDGFFGRLPELSEIA